MVVNDDLSGDVLQCSAVALICKKLRYKTRVTATCYLDTECSWDQKILVWYPRTGRRSFGLQHDRAMIWFMAKERHGCVWRRTDLFGEPKGGLSPAVGVFWLI